MIPGINSASAPLLDYLQARLAATGNKLTLPRRVVLLEIARLGSSFTATDLLESVEAATTAVGRATVFRTLDLLVALGVLQRVHTETGGNWGHSYVVCGLGEMHHHHLICTACGCIEDFGGCHLEEMVRSLQAQTSFQVEGHHLEFYGKCEKCRHEGK